MTFEHLDRSGQRFGRVSSQTRTRLSVAQPREAPFRLSLGGVRLPVFLLIVTTLSRAHQYAGFLKPIRPAMLLFLTAIVMLLMADRRTLAPENWKELPSKLIMALGGAALLSAPLGISLGGSMAFFLDTYIKVI